MPYRIQQPVDVTRLQQVLDALESEIGEREQAAAELARRNAELHGELRRRLAESESSNRVLARLLQRTVLAQVLDIVCAEAQGLIGATGSAVLLLTDQAWLEVKHRLGRPLAGSEPVPVDGSVAGQVVRQGEAVLLNDPGLFEHAILYQWPTDLTALLAVPLEASGRVIGVLDVVNKEGGFTEEDVPVMSVFATQAALAIEHTRLQRQAEQLAVLGERQRLAVHGGKGPGWRRGRRIGRLRGIAVIGRAAGSRARARCPGCRRRACRSPAWGRRAGGPRARPRR